MDHDGQPEPSGREVGRGGHVSAEAEHYVSLSAPQQPYGGMYRLKQARPQKHQVLSDSPRHRYRRDQLEFQTGRWDDRGLQSARSAECRKRQPRAQPAKLEAGRDQR
jgi:hypothetical protein